MIAFEDLGMEAIYEFEVEDMPVTVAVDSTGFGTRRRATRVERQNSLIPGAGHMRLSFVKDP